MTIWKTKEREDLAAARMIIENIHEALEEIYDSENISAKSKVNYLAYLQGDIHEFSLQEEV